MGNPAGAYGNVHMSKYKHVYKCLQDQELTYVMLVWETKAALIQIKVLRIDIRSVSSILYDILWF